MSVLDVELALHASSTLGQILSAELRYSHHGPYPPIVCHYNSSLVYVFLFFGNLD